MSWPLGVVVAGVSYPGTGTALVASSDGTALTYLSAQLSPVESLAAARIATDSNSNDSSIGMMVYLSSIDRFPGNSVHGTKTLHSPTYKEAEEG